MTTSFIPFELYSGTKISAELLSECLEKWCVDKPGASFKMTSEGAWLYAPLEYLGQSIDIFTSANEVSVSFKSVGNDHCQLNIIMVK